MLDTSFLLGVLVTCNPPKNVSTFTELTVVFVAFKIHAEMAEKSKFNFLHSFALPFTFYISRLSFSAILVEY